MNVNPNIWITVHVVIILMLFACKEPIEIENKKQTTDTQTILTVSPPDSLMHVFTSPSDERLGLVLRQKKVSLFQAPLSVNENAERLNVLTELTDLQNQLLLAPGGQSLAYIEDAVLHIHTLDATHQQYNLPETGAFDPEWSPDAQNISMIMPDHSILNIDLSDQQMNRIFENDQRPLMQHSVATSAERLAVLSEQDRQTIYSVDLKDGTLMDSIHTEHKVQDLALSPDGVKLAWIEDNEGANRVLRVHHIETDREMIRQSVSGFWEYIQWNEDGDRIMAGGRNAFMVVNLMNETTIDKTFPSSENGKIQSWAFAKDGESILFLEEGFLDKIAIYDPNTGFFDFEHYADHLLQQKPVWSADGQHFLYKTSDNAVMYDRTANARKIIKLPEDAASPVAWSMNKNWLAFLSNRDIDWQINLYSPNDGQRRYHPLPYKGGVTKFNWLEGTHYLALVHPSTGVLHIYQYENQALNLQKGLSIDIDNFCWAPANADANNEFHYYGLIKGHDHFGVYFMDNNWVNWIKHLYSPDVKSVAWHRDGKRIFYVERQDQSDIVYREQIIF